MLKQTTLQLFPLLFLALVRTASAACTSYSYTTCDDGIVHWFDPGTGEICDPLNCGGDRAGPARKDVPGCPQYTGTKTRATSASYLSCWTPSASASATASGSGSGGSMTETEAENTGTGSGSGGMASATQMQTTTTTTSTGDGSEGGNVTATPATTMPPDVSGTSTNDETGSASETDTETASAEPTDNAGVFNGRGSLVAVVGAVVGAVALM